MTDKDTPLFPLCVFPVIIQSLVKDLMLDPVFSLNYLGATLLFAVSVAIGNSRELVISEGWHEKAMLYMALLGDTGAVKTPHIKFALKPIYNIDNYYLPQYAAQLREWRRMPSDRRCEKEKPIPKQLCFKDFTLESLMSSMTKSPHGLVVLSDELNGWISSFNRYRQGGGDLEQWLSIFSGVPITINRKTQDDILHIPNPFVGVLGGLQPDILPKVFSGDKMDNGFFYRLLFVNESDDTRPVKWVDQIDLPSNSGDIWEQFIRSIFNSSGYFDNTMSVKEYHFSQDAWQWMCHWQNEIEERNTQEPRYKTGIFRKVQTYSLRFVLIIHTMREIAGEIDSSNQIDFETAVKATTLADYFYETAQIAYEMVLKDNRIKDFFRLLNGLNTFFTTEQALEVGGRMGMSRAKVFRLLGVQPNDPFLRKLKHGKYEKLE